MKPIAGILIFVMALTAGMPLLLADEESVQGVAGCSSIKLNKDLSLEDQQSICHAGEYISSTSCAVSGSGICSSPKLNDTMPDADHCICIAEEASESVAE